MKTQCVDEEDVLGFRKDVVRKLGLVKVKLLALAAAGSEHLVHPAEGEAVVADCTRLR